MCVSPYFVSKEHSKKSEYLADTVNYLEKYCSKSVINALRPTRFSCLQVPCGHCIECLHAKQNDLATRCYIEANKRGSMVFVTLTYEDFYLPIAYTPVIVDKDTGEVFRDAYSRILSDGDLSELCITRNSLVDGFKRQKLGSSPRFIFKDSPEVLKFLDFSFYDLDNFEYGLFLTPSLNRRDVRLWLKRCRVVYEREHGVKLPDFSYVCVGEYGPKTCRPHYHLAFFGLDERLVNWLCSNWFYGFSKVEKVKPVNKDGSNGFLGASRYIGKYMRKGAFECSSVKEGFSEKPRLMVSVDLGVDLDDRAISYYRCYDLVGKYDLFHVLDHFENGKPFVFSENGNGNNDNILTDLRKLHEYVKKRQNITISGFKYSLPKIMLKRIWCYRDHEGVYRSTPVYRAFTTFVSSDLLGDFISKFKSDNPFALDSEVVSAVAGYKQNQVSLALSKNCVGEQNEMSFYAKSVF